jgi:hypothetical protein
MSEEATLMDRTAQQSYWLIARHKSGRLDVLTFDLSGGQEVLPIFTCEEDAAEVLQLGMWTAGWRAMEITAEKLTSVLLGPCAGVGRVALDPWPEIDTEMMVALIGMRREDFVGLITGEGKPLDPTVKKKASVHTSHPGFCSSSTVDKEVVAEERVSLRR